MVSEGEAGGTGLHGSNVRHPAWQIRGSSGAAGYGSLNILATSLVGTKWPAGPESRVARAGELETVLQGLDTSSFSGLSTFDNDMQLLHEHRLAYHRDLVLKRESLIKQVRSLPGFEFFLKPTPFRRLRRAAATGRVVIINISIFGADALIFDCTNPVCHVSLSKVDAAKSFNHTSGNLGPKQTRAGDKQYRQGSLTLPEVLDSIDVDTLKPNRETDLTVSDSPEQRQARADITEDRQGSRTLPRVWERIMKPILTAVGIPLQRIHDQIPTD